MTTRRDSFYRLSLTLAGLERGANFFILGLPPPTLPTYADHSARFAAGMGGRVAAGLREFEPALEQPKRLPGGHAPPDDRSG